MLASLSSDAIGACLMGVRAELCIFAVACVAYHFLSQGISLPKLASGKLPGKAVGSGAADKTRGKGRKQPVKPDLDSSFDSMECGEIESVFQNACEQDDHGAVLQCWNAMKKFEEVPPVAIANVVQSMQRFKKDTPEILRELKGFFQKYSGEGSVCAVNDLLASLGKRLDLELMKAVVDMLPTLGMAADQQTFEILLTTNFTMRNFSEVRALLAEMKRAGVPCTVRTNLVLLKTALKTNNLDEALTFFRELRSSWQDADLSQSEAPRHIIAQLAELACREHRLEDFLSELVGGVQITEEMVQTLLAECVRQKDTALAQRVERLAREHGIALSDQTYALLVKSLSKDATLVSKFLEEALAHCAEIGPDFSLAILSFCSQTRNVAMADKLYENLQDKKLNVVSALVRFYAEQEENEKACAIYEKDIASLATEEHRSIFLDPRVERSLMNAAIRCGRSELAKTLLNASPSDLAKYINMIRNCAAENNLAGAKAVFEAAMTSGVELNNFVYNALLDACVECKDLKAAEDFMEKTRKAGMIDVVSFNTLIKAHLQLGHFTKGRALVEEMKKEGLQPNMVTFNEFINAMIAKGRSWGFQEIWGIVEEMQQVNVKPNRVTCSILLKCLNASSDMQHITRTMNLINTMDEPMDEVLLSSVVEACVRIGQPELLSARLEMLKDSSGTVCGAHTFGSLIKAYGHAQDIDGVWRCWKDMRSRHIRPTSITMGCMVEAVVNNGDTEGAYELICQMQDDEQCCEALNSVIYCSVLKGFAREKKLQRVWAVHREMVQRKVEISVVSFNTILDACARCGRMDQMPHIQEEMEKLGVRPNVITYSAMLKGYCRMGDVQTGFTILRRMKRESSARPDEIMYNTLLDGCVRGNLVEEGLKLLEEMQHEGVKPSNYTLSILVKLLSRSRNLDGAFAIVEDLSSKHNFKPNVHVYTNLILACLARRSLGRAMQTLERMCQERVQPDARLYSILVRECLRGGRPEDATGLLRAGLRLPGAISALAGLPPSDAGLDAALVNEILVGLAECGHAGDLAAPLLADLKKHNARIRIEPATQHRITQSPTRGPTGRTAGDAAVPWRRPSGSPGSSRPAR